MPDPVHSLSELLALDPTVKPRYPYLTSLTQHVQQNAGDISSLQAGSAPGWGGAIDSRWIGGTTGTNAYSLSVPTPPSTADYLFDGLRYTVRIGNRNTDRTCSLNLGSIEGAVPIKIVSTFGVVTDPYIGDLKRIHSFMYDASLGAWICLNPQGYKRTILADEMGQDDGVYSASAYSDPTGRFPSVLFPSGGEYAAWLPPIVLPDPSVDYVLEVSGIMATVEVSKNIKLKTDAHLYTAGGDWSDTTAEESGVDDDISVPDEAASRFTHVGVNLQIPSGDLVEENMNASIALIRDDATTNNHGGGFYLLDLLVREGA